MRIILASSSPRRREILQNLGLTFTVLTSDADEHSDVTDPAALVRELAVRKGSAVREMLRGRGEDLSDTLIISADTVVASEGKILGKPRDRAHAAEMLRQIAGREHTVYSGLCLICGARTESLSERTDVTVAPLTEEEIARYLETGEADDKAGAYAVQGLFSMYIAGIKGCYFNVMGLPVHAMYRLAKERFDIDLGALRG